jgi:uncharacterized protein YegP (UPF0339 family)
MAHFVVFKGKSKRKQNFYWRLVGSNGEIMAQSEAYLRRHSATRGANRFADAVLKAPIIHNPSK